MKTQRGAVGWTALLHSLVPMRRQKTSACSVDIYSITLHFYWSFARYFKDSRTNSCFFDWLPQNFDHIDVWTLHSLQLWTTECHFISLLQKECFYFLSMFIKIRAWVNQGSDTPSPILCQPNQVFFVFKQQCVFWQEVLMSTFRLYEAPRGGTKQCLTTREEKKKTAGWYFSVQLDRRSLACNAPTNITIFHDGKT